MASDNFVAVDGTALATHDAKWVSTSNGSRTYAVANFEINNNICEVAAAWSYAGARYSASTSDISQIDFVGGSIVSQRNCAVRMGSGTLGYCVTLGAYSAPNFTECYIGKNGAYFATVRLGGAWNASVNHTLKITVEGTSTVTIHTWVDGVANNDTTDSSSPIGSGNPGFWVNEPATIADSRFDNWTDGLSDIAIVGTCTFVSAGTSMASDNFTGADGTSLSAHDSKWSSAGSSVANFSINSNSCRNASWQHSSAYYSGSTTRDSTVTLLANTPYNNVAGPGVDMVDGSHGYTAYLYDTGADYISCRAAKNGNYLGQFASGSWAKNASHTVRITATGTSTVTLTAWVDGIQVGTVQDSSSPLSPGFDGIWVRAIAAAAANYFDDWYSGGTSVSPNGVVFVFV